jgi:hypothetical protein
MPSASHSVASIPSDATRNRYSTSAGKPAGVSCTPGRMSSAPPTTTTKTAPAASAAFQPPRDAASERRTRAAATIASTEMAIIAKNSTVRRSMVSGLPTDGGLAGYLMNGTRVIDTKAPPASSAAVARAPLAPTRP